MNCMNATKYEIDMLGVGAADALLVRFFDENDKAYIILVDAGNYCNGETIAKFVKERYNTFQIDLAICTHCDDDHFGGFIFLLEDVRQINHFQCFICLLATCSILLIHYIHIQFFHFLWYIDYTI